MDQLDGSASRGERRPPVQRPAPGTTTPVQRAFWVSYSALILLSAAHWVQGPEAVELPIPLATASARAGQATPIARLPWPPSDLRLASYQVPVMARAPAAPRLAETLTGLPWADKPCTSRTGEVAGSPPAPVQLASTDPVSPRQLRSKRRTAGTAQTVAHEQKSPASQRMPGHPRASTFDSR